AAFGVAQLSARSPAVLAHVGLAVLGMAAAYGGVCGAMMLAGEREGGTLVLLDIFLGRRGLLWLAKGLLGVAPTGTQAPGVAAGRGCCVCWGGPRRTGWGQWWAGPGRATSACGGGPGPGRAAITGS